MLTEKEAWLFLADAWASPQVDDVGKCFVKLKDTLYHGLCGCFLELNLMGHIDQYTRSLMFNKIEAYRREQNLWRMFLWHTDEDGAAQRVEFCKTQAEKLCGSSTQ